MPFRIRTLNAISQAGLSRLPGDRYLVGHDITQPDALLVRSASFRNNQPIDPSVLAVARAGAGTNNIPIAEYSKHGIPVFNTPGANANAVKELVVAGLFLAARNIVDAAAFAHRLEGDHATMDKLVEAGKKNYVGFELLRPGARRDRSRCRRRRGGQRGDLAGHACARLRPGHHRAARVGVVVRGGACHLARRPVAALGHRHPVPSCWWPAPRVSSAPSSSPR